MISVSEVNVLFVTLPSLFPNLYYFCQCLLPLLSIFNFVIPFIAREI